jgi:phospholipid/cholesterol/gamma-HCH transport system substrate-binding protein
MSPYRRNVMIGVVVLGGLLIFAWMLIQFGAGLATPFAPDNQPVRFIADRADGISNGSSVTYLGVIVGKVENVSRSDDETQVYINGTVDTKPPLPANLKAVIRSQGLVGGGALVVLELTDEKPSGTLAKDQTIQAHYVGLDILPPEFADLANELRKTVKDLRESNIIGNLNDQITKAGTVMDSLQTLVSDPQMRDNLKTSLANIRASSANFEKLTNDLDHLSTSTSDAVGKTQLAVLDLSRQFNGRLEQLSKLLDQFQSIAEKVNKGQGTVGSLVNDNRLYESMVDTARDLNTTVADLRRLVEQWEQEGVSLKVK